MYLDLTDGTEIGPDTGDWLVSRGSAGAWGTAYFVVESRRVKRRDPSAFPRFEMRVEGAQITEDCFVHALLAAKRGELKIFEFHWYKRQSRRLTFEQHMARRV